MEFKTIPETGQKYRISIDGTQVYNTETGRYLKIGEQHIKGKPTGYLYVTLLLTHNTYEARRIAIHRLVLITFYGYPYDVNKKWVNHIDGNKQNNHVSNLEWTTVKENIRHAHRTGLIKPRTGKDHPMYGRKQPYSARKRMSEAKQGTKHPKFKGHYIVHGFKFPSANQVQRDWGIPAMTVIRRTKNPNFPDYSFIPEDKEMTSEAK